MEDAQRHQLIDQLQDVVDRPERQRVLERFHRKGGPDFPSIKLCADFL